jgi:FtsH-binding integral membrane protein
MDGYTYTAPTIAGQAMPAERAEFIRQTYLHLAVAILSFGLIEFVLVNLPFAASLAKMMTGGYMWLVVLGAFMVVSWFAENWANSDVSRELQYAGLAVYVVAEAIIFLPLLFVVVKFGSPMVLPISLFMTFMLFLGLSAVVLITKADFSFLRTTLVVGGLVAFGAIVASLVFGFSLGILFVCAMIFFASAVILYNTSNVLHHYRTDQYVGASLSLFASIALLFWYVVRLVMSFSSDD